MRHLFLMTVHLQNVISEKPFFVVWHASVVPVIWPKLHYFWQRSYCCGFSWTVWVAFAAHDKSSPVQWGAVYLYPPLRQQQQPRRAHLEEDVYPQLVKRTHSCTLRCVCSCVNSLCFSFSWGFVLYVIRLAPVVWSCVHFGCTLAWCVWRVSVCVCTCG